MHQKRIHGELGSEEERFNDIALCNGNARDLSSM
jgi:hypothetical protein